ncbi:MAG TPA: aspartate/glutamate racemase family protein [Pyrinomonadaceae bacterium]|jgi:aspartate racemase
MKTLGLIGGTTWVSTVDYYKYINQMVAERLGGLNSAQILLYSLNFDELKTLFEKADWARVAEVLTSIAENLETAGAEAIVLCSNTIHIAAREIEKRIGIPLIDVTDAAAREINDLNLKKVALLGTRFTMDKDFYPEKLGEFGIETIVPSDAEREFINRSIFEELGKNVFTEETKRKYLEIIENLRMRGAEGVIFGCTEIPMLIKAEDCAVPSFDTTVIHARAAVEYALAD